MRTSALLGQPRAGDVSEPRGARQRRTRTSTAAKSEDYYIFFSITIWTMASEGVGEKDVPPVVPIHGLKELLKESLTEILRENPSLLQTEQSHGKCSYRLPLGRPRTRGGRAPTPGRSGWGRWWPQYMSGLA